VAEVVKEFDGYEYELGYYKVVESTDKFILDNEN
jgi:hypothetical protein